MGRTVTAIATLSTAAVGAIAAVLLGRKASSTADAVKRAVDGQDKNGAPTAPSLPTVDVRLTTYWPWAAKSDVEKKMEGAPVDRKGNPLHSVEDFLVGKSDHVSLSGDDAVWPFGQKILIPWGDKTLTGRVTDTGGHFRGAGKLVRAVGYEPIDVCVYSTDTKPPSVKVTAQVVAGDHLDKNKAKAVAYDKAGKPVVVAGSGFDLLGAEVVPMTDCFGRGDIFEARSRRPGDRQWRTTAAQYATARGEDGKWVRGRAGDWMWRGSGGRLSSAPVCLMGAAGRRA